MKNFITSLALIIILVLFSAFITQAEKTKEVLHIVTPTKIEVDLNNNNLIDKDEIVCIEDVEAFSLQPSEDFVNHYTKKLKISKNDIISLGYLGQEFAQKRLQNKRISIELTHHDNAECKSAKIKLNGLSYSKILQNSGYGISGGEIGNLAKFKENLENSRKLNLVILNHKSNKYHTLDCKFGKLAHDTTIIPEKQLPENAKPCKYCHKVNEELKNLNKIKSKTAMYSLGVTQGHLALYITDFTQNLRPTNTCSTKECKALVKLIDDTKNSIDIAIYGYDEVTEITKALQRAKDREVNIRFVYDENSNPNKNYYKGNHIIKELATISKSDKSNSQSLTNMLMHNKFIIFDNTKVFTGSMNISQTDLSGFNENNTLVINSKEIAELYTKEFEQMLSGKFHTTKGKHYCENKFKIGESTVEIYFSPQDKTSTRIIELIKGAKKYIYIPTFLITHSSISNELINAHNMGVDVKVIMDANNVYSRNTKHDILRKYGIPLKVENYAGKLHSKAMIIDDEYLVLGSMNFSNSGENKNDENTIIVKNEKFAQRYKEFFEYLWELIPNKYLYTAPKAESKESIGSCNDGIDNNFNGKKDSEEILCR